MYDVPKGLLSLCRWKYVDTAKDNTHYVLLVALDADTPMRTHTHTKRGGIAETKSSFCVGHLVAFAMGNHDHHWRVMSGASAATRSKKQDEAKAKDEKHLQQGAP